MGQVAAGRPWHSASLHCQVLLNPATAHALTLAATLPNHTTDIMTNENIINTIKQMTGFTDSDLGIVLKHFETKSIKKKTNILENMVQPFQGSILDRCKENVCYLVFHQKQRRGLQGGQEVKREAGL